LKLKVSIISGCL